MTMCAGFRQMPKCTGEILGWRENMLGERSNEWEHLSWPAHMLPTAAWGPDLATDIGLEA